MRWIRCAASVVVLAATALPSIAQAPRTQRIVTLGGAITETVFALGAGALVVGRDASSSYPAAVQRLPNVGYFRQAGAEGIMALRPTLVIADTGSVPATVAQLRAAGVRVVLMPVGDTKEVAVQRIERIGALLGTARAADSLASHVRDGVAGVEVALSRRTSRPRALFIYARGVGTLFVAGSATGAAEMLRFAGAENAMMQLSGYRPLTPEAVASSGAEVIVLTTNGLASLGGISGLLTLPGVAQTPAGRTRRIVTVADDLLLGFGPRLPQAIAELARVIHASPSVTSRAASLPRD